MGLVLSRNNSFLVTCVLRWELFFIDGLAVEIFLFDGRWAVSSWMDYLLCRRAVGGGGTSGLYADDSDIACCIHLIVHVRI